MATVDAAVRRDVWQAICDVDTSHLPTQTPAWMDAVTAATDLHDVSRLYLFDDGVQAVLPLAAGGLPGRLAQAGAMPAHWGTGGFVSTGPVSVRNAALVLSDLARLSYSRVTIWPDAVQGELWEAARHLVARPMRAEPRRFHVLDLTPGFDAIVAKSFDKYSRRYLKRAAEAGVTTEHGSSRALVDEFFHVLQLAVPRWAGQQHEPVAIANARAARRDPIQKFRAICDHMGDRAVVGIARVGRRPVAAVLYLLGTNADILWAPVDPEIGPQVHAPTTLYAESIRAACDAGCRRFSMGESGFSEGLDRFKRRLGAHPIDYFSYSIETIPFTRVEDAAKRIVKSVIGFRETAKVT